MPREDAFLKFEEQLVQFSRRNYLVDFITFCNDVYTHIHMCIEMYCDSFNTRKNLLLAITIRMCQHIFDKVFNREREIRYWPFLLLLFFFSWKQNLILEEKTDFKFIRCTKSEVKSLQSNSLMSISIFLCNTLYIHKISIPAFRLIVKCYLDKSHFTALEYRICQQISLPSPIKRQHARFMATLVPELFITHFRH